MNKSKRRKVYFYGELGLLNVLFLLLSNRQAFYNTRSFFLRLTIKIFPAVIPDRIKPIWFGDVKTGTGIRKQAYETALSKVKLLNFQMLSSSLKKVLNIDYELIVEKFLLDTLYQEYEFSNFARQYAAENPNCEVILSKLSAIAFQKRGIIFSLKFLFGVIAVPIFCIYFCMKNSGLDADAELAIKDSIICEIDSLKIFDMFSSLLQGREKIVYFTQRCYLDNFKNHNIPNLKVITHFLSKSEKRMLRFFAFRFFVSSFFDYKELSKLGMLYFDLYKAIANGVLITPRSNKCAYLTFEHMSTLKAIRNEILREANNISVFVPYNSYAIDHYFSPEYRYNYDVLCSPCKLLEDVYQIQNAATSVYLPTGSYSCHQLQESKDNDLTNRLKKLEDFKSSNIVITILSTGIQDETISGESRLMALANKISSINGVRVIIRPKPVTPVKKYKDYLKWNFYKNQSVLLTDEQYNLFDFLHVTDLFITGVSSSAVDLCNAGGEFFSVDFWSDRDMYLWQTAVDGVFLEENEAFEAIKAWVNDDPPGQRDLHSKRMKDLRALTGYWMGDFEAYKKNLLSLLNPYLPFDS